VKPRTPVIAAPGGGGAAPVKGDEGPDLTKKGAVASDFAKFLEQRGE